MSIAKEERWEQELKIFSMRHEGGVQTVRDWLYRERDELNAKWPGQVGDDLVRLQGEAKKVSALIKVIDAGPTIKRTEA